MERYRDIVPFKLGQELGIDDLDRRRLNIKNHWVHLKPELVQQQIQGLTPEELRSIAGVLRTLSKVVGDLNQVGFETPFPEEPVLTPLGDIYSLVRGAAADAFIEGRQ